MNLKTSDTSIILRLDIKKKRKIGSDLLIYFHQFELLTPFSMDYKSLLVSWFHKKVIS